MDMQIRIAKSGKDALRSTNPNDFIFHSAYNTFKIISQDVLTSQSVNADPTTFQVAHGQGTIPTVFAFAKYPDGYVALPREVPRTTNLFRTWELEVDDTNIYFVFTRGDGVNYNVDISYFIFEAPVDISTNPTPAAQPTANKVIISKLTSLLGALKEPNPNNQIFNSDYDTLKYYLSDSVTLTPVGTSIETTVDHNLGYTPFFVAYVNNFGPGSDKYNLCPGYFATFSGYVHCDAYVDSTKLYLKVATDYLNTGASFTLKYKIFRNRLNL